MTKQEKRHLARVLKHYPTKPETRQVMLAVQAIDPNGSPKYWNGRWDEGERTYGRYIKNIVHPDFDNGLRLYSVYPVLDNALVIVEQMYANSRCWLVMQ